MNKGTKEQMEQKKGTKKKTNKQTKEQRNKGTKEQRNKEMKIRTGHITYVTYVNILKGGGVPPF